MGRVNLGKLGGLGALSWGIWASCDGGLTKGGGLLNLGPIEAGQGGETARFSPTLAKEKIMTKYILYYNIMYSNNHMNDTLTFNNLEDAREYMNKIKREYKTYSTDRVCYVEFHIHKETIVLIHEETI